MIDSEPIHYKAFDEAIKTFGRHIPIEEFNHFYPGLSDLDQAKDMVKRYNLPITAEELVQRKQTIARRMLREEVVPQPGLIDLLKQLDENHYKKAVASSSLLVEIELVINALQINHLIDAYCSSEEVSHGKPAPDLFLLAAKKLEVLPENCLVLEDAPSGIKAAKAAGMKSYAIPSRETKGQDFSEATHVLINLSEVFSYLQHE